MPVGRIPLGPIGGDAIADLAADLLGEEPDEATVELLKGVGGSPFWATQLVTGLTRRRALGLPDDAAHAELISGIRRRMSMLPPLVASVVRIVAVCGRAVPPAEVACLLGDATSDSVYEAAVRARDEGLLAIAADGLSLPHDVIREAVEAHIPPPERRRLHRERGRQLIAAGATALTAAPHFLTGADADDFEAAEVALQAAAECVPILPAQAAKLALDAFALLDPRVANQKEDIGERVLAVLVDAQRDGDVLNLADILLSLGPAPDAAARIEVAAGRALWETSACELLERRMSDALARSGIPPVDRARLTALHALAKTRTRSAPEAGPAAAAALAEGERLADGLTRQIALLASTETARGIGDHQLALDHLDRLQADAPEVYLVERVRALQHLDRYAEAGTVLAKARLDAGGDLDRLLPSFLYAQAWHHHNLGEVEAAEASARALVREAEMVVNFAFALNARVILCACAIYRGQLPQARAVLEPLGYAVASEDPLRASRLHLMRAWLTAEEGDLDESVRIVAPMLAEAERGYHLWAWSPGWMRLFGGIAQQAGDAETADRALQLAETGAGRNPGLASLRGTAQQLKGHLRGDADLLRQAVATLRRSPRPLLLAGALRDLHVAAGEQTDDGRAALREADEIYERAGAYGLVSSPRSRAPRPSQGWEALTESEARIAELIVSGHTNRMAATKLGISPNTVGTHLRSVFAKLDVRSRVQLANTLNARPTRG